MKYEMELTGLVSITAGARHQDWDTILPELIASPFLHHIPLLGYSAIFQKDTNAIYLIII